MTGAYLFGDPAARMTGNKTGGKETRRRPPPRPAAAPRRERALAPDRGIRGGERFTHGRGVEATRIGRRQQRRQHTDRRFVRLLRRENRRAQTCQRQQEETRDEPGLPWAPIIHTRAPECATASVEG